MCLECSIVFFRQFNADSENTLTHIWKETLIKVFFYCSIAYCHLNHVDYKDKLKIRLLSSAWNLVTCLTSVCCYANETLQSVNTAIGHFDPCVCWIIVSYPEVSLSQTWQGQERSRRICSGRSNEWSPTTSSRIVRARPKSFVDQSGLRARVCC